MRDADDKHQQMAVPACLPYTDSTVRVASAEGARERRIPATARLHAQSNGASPERHSDQSDVN